MDGYLKRLGTSAALPSFLTAQVFWKPLSQKFFGNNANMTDGTMAKLSAAWPDALRDWKDWFNFRRLFRREVSGEVKISLLAFSTEVNLSLFTPLPSYSPAWEIQINNASEKNLSARSIAGRRSLDMHVYVHKSAVTKSSSLFEINSSYNRDSKAFLFIFVPTIQLLTVHFIAKLVACPKRCLWDVAGILYHPDWLLTSSFPLFQFTSLQTNEWFELEDVPADEAPVPLDLLRKVRAHFQNGVRVLLRFTLTPVRFTVNDFELVRPIISFVFLIDQVASVSHGSFNTPSSEVLFVRYFLPSFSPDVIVRDRDSKKPYFMKILKDMMERKNEGGINDGHDGDEDFVDNFTISDQHNVSTSIVFFDPSSYYPSRSHEAGI